MNDLIKNMPIEEKRQIHTAGNPDFIPGFCICMCVYFPATI